MESTDGPPANLADAQAQIANLRHALETRELIACAQGILMERFGIDTDAAMSALKRISMDRQLKVRALAAALVAGDGDTLIGLAPPLVVPAARRAPVRGLPSPPRSALSS